MKFVLNEKGSYKLYRISDKMPIPTSRLTVTSVEQAMQAGDLNWEYIVATSLEEAIIAWKNKSSVYSKKDPVAVELLYSSVTIVAPESK